MTGDARNLFLEIARRHSWLPCWEFEEHGYLEVVFFAGNPGLEAPLTMCFSHDALAWWSGDHGEEWFAIEDEKDRLAFLNSIEAWIRG